VCSDAQLAKVIVKFPRILEYKSERTIRPRLDFLRGCGVGQEDLAKVGRQAGGQVWPGGRASKRVCVGGCTVDD